MSAAPAGVLWTEDVLRFRDTDANGHVNNATFAQLCESGRVRLFQEHFVPLLTGRPRVFFVIARFTIDYRAELHFPGRTRTAVWVAAVGRSSLTIGQAIHRDDGRLAAEASAVCVLMNAETRRATGLPEAVREAARALVHPGPAGPG